MLSKEPSLVPLQGSVHLRNDLVRCQAQSFIVVVVEAADETRRRWILASESFAGAGCCTKGHLFGCTREARGACNDLPFPGGHAFDGPRGLVGAVSLDNGQRC